MDAAFCSSPPPWVLVQRTHAFAPFTALYIALNLESGFLVIMQLHATTFRIHL